MGGGFFTNRQESSSNTSLLVNLFLWFLVQSTFSTLTQRHKDPHPTTSRALEPRAPSSSLLPRGRRSLDTEARLGLSTLRLDFFDFLDFLGKYWEEDNLGGCVVFLGWGGLGEGGEGCVVLGHNETYLAIEDDSVMRRV